MTRVRDQSGGTYLCTGHTDCLKPFLHFGTFETISFIYQHSIIYLKITWNTAEHYTTLSLSLQHSTALPTHQPVHLAALQQEMVANMQELEQMCALMMTALTVISHLNDVLSDLSPSNSPKHLVQCILHTVAARELHLPVDTSQHQMLTFPNLLQSA